MEHVDNGCSGSVGIPPTRPSTNDDFQPPRIITNMQNVWTAIDQAALMRVARNLQTSTFKEYVVYCGSSTERYEQIDFWWTHGNLAPHKMLSDASPSADLAR